MAGKLSKLKLKCRQARAALARFKKVLDGINPENANSDSYEQVSARYDLLPNIYNSFHEAQGEIASANGDQDSNNETEISEFEELYFSLYSEMERFLKNFNVNNDESNDVQSENNVSIENNASENDIAHLRATSSETDIAPPGATVPEGTGPVRQGYRIPVVTGTLGGSNSTQSRDEVTTSREDTVNQNKTANMAGDTVSSETAIDIVPILPVGATVSPEIVPHYVCNQSRIMVNNSVNNNNSESNSNFSCVSPNMPLNNTNNNFHNNSLAPYNMFMTQPYMPQMKYEVPKFNGDFNNWLEFRDSFKALIHENPFVSNIQKLTHLRQSLSDDVLDTIKAIPISAQSYQLAWETLQKRYERGPLIIKHHIKNIIDFPQMFKETAKDLRKLYNNISNNLESLRNLKEPVDSWASIIITIVIEYKLDSRSKREWEKRCKNESKSLNEFLSFLSDKCALLESIDKNKLSSTEKGSSSTQGRHRIKGQGSTLTVSTWEHTCKHCNGTHFIAKCPQFQKLSPFQRTKIAKLHKLCWNCLKGHNGPCRAPPCTTCSKYHHSLLHFNRKENPPQKRKGDEFPVETEQSKRKKNDEGTSTALYCCNNVTTDDEVILSTAIVLVENSEGKLVKARAGLDNMSTTPFISEKLCKRLRLNPENVDRDISGINNSTNKCTKMVTVKFSSTYSNYKSQVSCFVLKEITSQIPIDFINKEKLKLPPNLSLADPCFNEPAGIDLLLHATIFWDVLGRERIKLPNSTAVIQETKLGWIIGG